MSSFVRPSERRKALVTALQQKRQKTISIQEIQTILKTIDLLKKDLTAALSQVNYIESYLNMLIRDYSKDSSNELRSINESTQ